MEISHVIILILFIIILIAILLCLRLLRNFTNDSTLEGFKCGTDENDLNNTHCLIPPNLPLDKPAYAKVGGEMNKTAGEPLVPEEGKYQFVKPQLLYDGIWKEKVNQIGNFAKNNWMIIPDGYRCLESGSQVYGADKFFNIKNTPIDGMKVPVDNCAEIVASERRVKMPLRTSCKYFPEPDMEDILGYRIP